MRELLARFLYRPATFVGGVVLLAVMLLTVADVAGRYLFSAPIPGTFELTELAMVPIAFLGLAYTQYLGEHITIDLVYERLPPLGRAILDSLTRLVSLGLVLVLTWQLIRFYERMQRSGEVTGVLGLPIYPVVPVAIVGFGLFALATLFDVVALFSRRRPERQEGQA